MPHSSADVPLDAQFAATRADAEALVAALDAAQGRWRPGPGRWSAAECLAHLAATTRLYLPALDAAIAVLRARGATARAPYRAGWLGRRLVASMEPTTGRGFRAPAATTPPSDVALAQAAGDFADAQDALRARLASVAGLDLGAVAVRSPLSPLLRMKLGTAFALLAAHERRHLAQAARLREAPGFPAR